MAVYCTYEGKRKTPRCCSSSHARRLTVVQGRFLALLEMTIWGKAVFSYRSLLHEGRLTIRDMLFFHLFSCLPGCFCFLPSHSPVFPCARKISRCARNDDTGKAVFSFSACLKRIPHSLSYRQYPIRPFGAPSPRGEGFWYGESGILISLTFPSGSEWRLCVALLHASGVAP